MLPFTARIERAHSYRARSASKKGTWLLPSIFLRPRVARAQKIIRLHPLLFCEHGSQQAAPPYSHSIVAGGFELMS